MRHELGQNLEPRNRPPVPCEVAQANPVVDPPLPRFAAEVRRECITPEIWSELTHQGATLCPNLAGWNPQEP